MRVLTVRQPWAWAIIHGGKDVENRVRNLAGSYRGPVAIHAALTWDGSTWDHLRSTPALLKAHEAARAVDELSLPEREHGAMDAGRGKIIGVVDLVGVHSSTSNSQTPMCWGPGETIGDRGAGFCSPWAKPAEYHLELANPRALAEPIPLKGALGLRTLPAAVVAQIGADRG